MKKKKSAFRRNYIDNGMWTWTLLIIFIIICLLLSLPRESKFSPTPEPGYTGDCHHWTEAEKWENKETCIWGFPTSTASGSWVWLHFSERSYPFPDFAADIDEYYGGNMKFTANNISDKYVGHCVEIFGIVEIEPNTYNGKTVEQPVIHVSYASQIVFCDDLIRK